MKRLCTAALALFIATPSTPAQAKGKSAPAALRRVFERSESEHSERMQAIRAVRDLDHASIAKALSFAHKQVHAEIGTLETRRLELNRMLDQNLMARANQKLKGGVRGARQERRRLREESFQSRRILDFRRAERQALEANCESLRSPEAQRWLLKNVVPRTKRSIGLRLACARAIGHSSTAELQLGRALARAKSADLSAVLLTGLAIAGPAATSTGEVVRSLLRDESPIVRELAARVLAAQVQAQSVLPLIDYLAATSGQPQKRAALLLEDLTGRSLGTSAASWRAWYTEHQDSPLSARKTSRGGSSRGKGPGEKRSRRKAQKKNGKTSTYMGIPQDGDSIVYLLDASASMKVKVDFDLPGTSTTDNTTRLDACKVELQRALKALRPPTKFSIVYFHETAGRFRDSPVTATPKNINAACTFVREIEPLFATNTYDGFLECFSLLSPALLAAPTSKSRRTSSGRNRAQGQSLGSGIDTIFLMTDGRPVIFDPTKRGQAGARDSFETILAAIRDWDPLERVTVHCIGIGKGLAKNQMRKLAAARGGEARFF